MGKKKIDELKNIGTSLERPISEKIESYKKVSEIAQRMLARAKRAEERRNANK